jgi:hypothetical protein
MRACTRFDLPPVEWQPDPEEFGWYMGSHHLTIVTEDIAAGCPGGYQRARLLSPLHRIYRKRTGDGARVSNPHFDKCEDWLAIDAILHLEMEEERAHGEWLRANQAAVRQENKV